MELQRCPATVTDALASVAGIPAPGERLPTLSRSAGSESWTASALLPPARPGDDELVDRIARRVVEQLGDRAVRDLAADIVSRTAERLVREEIERIKTGG